MRLGQFGAVAHERMFQDYLNYIHGQPLAMHDIRTKTCASRVRVEVLGWIAEEQARAAASVVLSAATSNF